MSSKERKINKLINSIYSNLTDGCSIVNYHLGNSQENLETPLKLALNDQIVQRIWDHDFTVWKSEPTEIINRLGWLDIANRMRSEIPDLINMADNVCLQGFKKVILLGMGGSSLAPEVLRKTFGIKEGYLDLEILDSTDPGTILSLDNKLDIKTTLFIVSTKSGTTPETLSFFKHFYNLCVNQVGPIEAGKHFIAITDPGSKLVEIAKDLGFQKIYENDPNIGGRYSALSYFGLVPAVLLGLDIEKLLLRAINAGERTQTDICNGGMLLGIVLGELAKEGRDKLTFILPSEIESFGDWAEQLIAESTGKEAKGILPIVGEEIGAVDVYTSDRVFVNFQIGSKAKNERFINSFIEQGHPVIKILLNDIYDLGGQFFLWEMATAIAGYSLKINPFDQPNVESSKVLTRRMLMDYKENRNFDSPEPVIVEDGIAIYGDGLGGSLLQIIQKFIEQSQKGSYVAIQAYVKNSKETDELLNDLRIIIRNNTHLATTLGYGPRFLHSTGQLHKGDTGKGLFIQLTADMPMDIPIPNEPGHPESDLTFGTLRTAQVLGDYQALLEANRKVMRIDLGSQVQKNLMKLISLYEN